MGASEWYFSCPLWTSVRRGRARRATGVGRARAVQTRSGDRSFPPRAHAVSQIWYLIGLASTVMSFDMKLALEEGGEEAGEK